MQETARAVGLHLLAARIASAKHLFSTTEETEQALELPERKHSSALRRKKRKGDGKNRKATSRMTRVPLAVQALKAAKGLSPISPSLQALVESVRQP